MHDRNIMFGGDRDGLPPEPLDHIDAARVLGGCVARDNLEPLRLMLSAAAAAEVSAFLCRLAAGDPDLAAAEVEAFVAARAAASRGAAQ